MRSCSSRSVSYTHLFAAVALPWDDALLVSLHGNDPAPGLAACRTHPKVGVLTDPGTGFADVVRATADLGRTYVLAERLGESDERVRVLGCLLYTSRCV